MYGQRTRGGFLEDIRQVQGVAVYQIWIAGFLTGVNQILPDTYDITGHGQFSDVYDWVSNHCAAHPDETFGAALLRYYQFAYPTRFQDHTEVGQ